MFLAEVGQEEPGLNRLIRAAFKLLGLQTYFTAGVKEVRAWTIHIGDTAPQAAGVIHTDFETRIHPRPDHRLRRFHRLQGRAGCQGRGQDAQRRQGIRGQGWRRVELPVQRLSLNSDFLDFSPASVRPYTEPPAQRQPARGAAPGTDRLARTRARAELAEAQRSNHAPAAPPLPAALRLGLRRFRRRARGAAAARGARDRHDAVAGRRPVAAPDPGRRADARHGPRRFARRPHHRRLARPAHWEACRSSPSRAIPSSRT